MAKVSRGINNLRMSHAYEDTQMSLGGSSAGLLMQRSSGNVSGGSRGKRKRREIAPSGSGSRALQSGSQAKSSRALSALDDYESVNAAIARAGNPTPPTAPSMTLEEYLSTPTKTE